MEDIDFMAQHKGLLVTHLNVRSLWSKIDLIQTTFSKFNIDIITFSETWLTEVIPDDLMEINGYDIFRQDRKWNDDDSITPKKGGGVCLYIRKEYQSKTGHIAELELSNVDIECQYIQVNFDRQKNVLIINIYRPPKGNITNFVIYLDQLFENIDQTKFDIILLGDLNTDFCMSSDPNTKKVNH